MASLRATRSERSEERNELKSASSSPFLLLSFLPSLPAFLLPNPDARGQLTLSSLHDERHTLPSRVVDKQNGLGEGRAVRSLGNGVVLEVSRLSVGGGVLSEKSILLLDGRNTTKNLDLKNEKEGRETSQDGVCRRREG